MLESIAKIEEYCRDLSVEEVFGKSQVQDAVVRRLEIIGEAREVGQFRSLMSSGFLI